MNSFSVLGEEAFLGSHVTVTDGGKLDESARMSANVAVHSEVPPRTLAHGVPPKQATIFALGEARLQSESAVLGSASHQEGPAPAQ